MKSLVLVVQVLLAAADTEFFQRGPLFDACEEIIRILVNSRAKNFLYFLCTSVFLGYFGNYIAKVASLYPPLELQRGAVAPAPPL